MRVTKSDLIWLQDNINKVLENRQNDKELYVSYAYGRPRATLFSRSTGNMIDEISPRLPRPQMYDWLSAFYKGLTFDD